MASISALRLSSPKAFSAFVFALWSQVFPQLAFRGEAYKDIDPMQLHLSLIAIIIKTKAFAWCILALEG